MKHLHRSARRASAAQFPLGWSFFSTPRRTAGMHTTGSFFHPFRILRYPPDRLRPARGIFWRSQGHRCQTFIICSVALTWSKHTFLPLVSNIANVSWETVPNVSRLYCRGESLRPTAPISLVLDGDGSKQCRGAPLWRFSVVHISARWTHLSLWTASRCGSSAVCVLPGSNVFRENPRRSACRRFTTRRFSADNSNRPVGACRRSSVPKAGAHHLARRQCSTHRVSSVWTVRLKLDYSLARRRYLASGGNTWAHRQWLPAPPHAVPGTDAR